MSSNISNWAFWAGNGIFRVQQDGYVYASNIDATAGHIGSFNLDQNFLYSGSGTDRAGMSIYGSGMAFWAGNENSNIAPFKVDHAGNLTASAANITGAITATSGSFTGSIHSSSGSIGGWSIGSNYLSNSGGGYSVRFEPQYLAAKASGDTWEYLRWYTLVDQVSDKKTKHEIKDIDEKYNDLFDKLKPVTFKYNEEYEPRPKNEDKIHIGFIAQDIKKAEKETDTEDLSMVYGSKLLKLDKQEIIALNTWQIQMLKKEIKELKDEIKSLKEHN